MDEFFYLLENISCKCLLIAILEAQVERRSPATRAEKSWQIDRKPIKPKWQE